MYEGCRHAGDLTNDMEDLSLEEMAASPPGAGMSHHETGAPPDVCCALESACQLAPICQLPCTSQLARLIEYNVKCIEHLIFVRIDSTVVSYERCCSVVDLFILRISNLSCSHLLPYFRHSTHLTQAAVIYSNTCCASGVGGGGVSGAARLLCAATEECAAVGMTSMKLHAVSTARYAVIMTALHI